MEWLYLNHTMNVVSPNDIKINTENKGTKTAIAK